MPLGGQWYELQTPIPLPQGGTGRYVIDFSSRIARDTKLLFPQKRNATSSGCLKVPILLLAQMKQTGHLFVMPLMKKRRVTNSSQKLLIGGGRPVRLDIEVVFAEGNPDTEGDSVIDEDADILGRVTIRPTDWADGIYVLQHATVTLDLDKPLATGVHKIYVLADPDDPTIEDKILGNIQEARQF